MVFSQEIFNKFIILSYLTINCFPVNLVLNCLSTSVFQLMFFCYCWITSKWIHCFQIRELRHLFNDDTMFVALQSHEKFPEEGFDVDVQSEWWIFFFLNVLNLIIFSGVIIWLKVFKKWYHLIKLYNLWILETVSFGFSDRSDENNNLMKYKL